MNSAPPYPRPMQLGKRSGLVVLRDGIESYFRDYSVPAVVAPVGFKYRSFTLNQAPGGANRVCIIPGEFDGELAPKARKYGALSRNSLNASSVVNPRELLSWARPFTLSIWSGPVLGQPENEQEAIARVEDLLEQTVRAIQTVAHASIEWGEVTINAPPVENAFGAELLVKAVQIGPIFDITYDTTQASPSVPRGTVT